MANTIRHPLTDLSRSEIESKARAVLERLHLTTIPVNPLRIAEREEISAIMTTFDDPNMVGMIVRRGDEVAIVVSKDDPPLRRRLAIAHDLGHYFLHLDRDGDDQFLDREVDLFRNSLRLEDGFTAERRREVEANLFAASLLMPEDDVRRYWKERRSIEELAEIFSVSTTEMGSRVASLDLD